MDDQKTMIDKLVDLNTERDFTKSLFVRVLERLNQSLIESHVMDEWVSKPSGKDGVIIDAENPRDFCRLWSSLQFLFCKPNDGQLEGEDYPDFAVFGDGFAWAGCTLMYMTGHKERFQYLDFVRYLLKMNAVNPFDFAVDPKLKKKGKLTKEQEDYPKIEAFLATGQEIMDLNQMIFSIISSYISPPRKAIIKFHPVLASSEKEGEKSKMTSRPSLFSVQGAASASVLSSSFGPSSSGISSSSFQPSPPPVPVFSGAVPPPVVVGASSVPPLVGINSGPLPPSVPLSSSPVAAPPPIHSPAAPLPPPAGSATSASPVVVVPSTPPPPPNMIPPPPGILPPPPPAAMRGVMPPPPAAMPPPPATMPPPPGPPAAS